MGRVELDFNSASVFHRCPDLVCANDNLSQIGKQDSGAVCNSPHPSQMRPPFSLLFLWARFLLSFSKEDQHTCITAFAIRCTAVMIMII